jgi:peptide/nickel transport system substrate-binding protein
MPSRRAFLSAAGVALGATAAGVRFAHAQTKNAAAAGGRGGIVNVATIGEPPTLDPTVSTADLVGIITQHIFETLFTFDADWQVIPLLARDMPAISAGGTVYDLPLREGVRFHNGSLMTAKDVVASLKRWLAIASRGRTVAPNMASVEASGDAAVRITMKSPYAPLLSLLAFNNSAAIILPEGKQDNPMKEVVGTGPYRLKERQPDQYIQLVRFADYAPRSGAPNGYGGARLGLLDEVRFVPVPDANTRVEAARAGQYEFIGNLPVDALAQLKSGSKSEPVLLKPFGFPSLNFNTRKGLSANQAFRQAVRAALSMSDMLAAAFGSEDFYTAEGALYPPGFVWHTQKGVSAAYNLADPDKAGSLLKAAKYDGSTPFRILTSQQYEFHYKMAQVCAEYLKAAGIKVDMQVVDWATLTQRRANPDLWDMYVSDSPFLPEPALIGQLDSSGPIGWDSEAGRRAIAAFNGELDPKKRLALWAELQAVILDEVPYIKVGDYNALAAQSPHLKGVPPAPWPYFWNASLS